MAEVRKGKSENQNRSRTRAAASSIPDSQTQQPRKRAGATSSPAERLPVVRKRPLVRRPEISASDREIKRLLAETQDQLSLIHGVLEELCERQEALSAWQMEFSKRLVTLQEAQWRSLEDLAGVDMGRPVEKAFGIQLDQVDPEVMDDRLDEAQRMMDEMNSQAMPKRAERIRKRRDPLKPHSIQASFDEETQDKAEELRKPESSPESVFVIPTKVDVH